MDTEAHNKFLPDKAVQLNPLPAAGVLDPAGSNSSGGHIHSCGGGGRRGHKQQTAPDPTNTVARRALTAKELMLAVPHARGYSLKLKRWLILFVDQLSSIIFDQDAFDSLVLANGRKELVRCFVEQHRTGDDFDDVISGKGRGLILLLAGPPGVGKTLTAEAVSEHLKVPLYIMSAGDLGLDPKEIETTLNTLFAMIQKWNAIILMDEADVFLEARSTHDLERNKLVSIFLRVLEYYQGILFLTTNRISNIDEAFHSRIHCTLRYAKLPPSSRLLVWKRFLGTDHNLTSGELEKLARNELNGRQIKNMVRTSRMLARSEQVSEKPETVKVDTRHIRTVVDIEKENAWE